MGFGVIKSYIWGFGLRFSHLWLILTFIFAYILSDMKGALYWHIVFGALFALALVFRIIWGFIGTKYSKFSDFNFSDLFGYFASFFGQKKRYLGHNPASCAVIILMLILGLVCAGSGLILYGINENSGIFAFLYDEYVKFAFAEPLHKISANALLGLIIIHTCGALIDKFIYKNDALNAMLTGYKLSLKNETITFNNFQKIFTFIWIFGLFGALIYFLDEQNFILKSRAVFSDFGAQNAEFMKECASCHMAYAPWFLPKKSWELMMADLENHFGDDASIDEATNKRILAFLQANSAQNNANKIAFNILKYAKNDENIAITQNEYWIKKHKKIKSEIFKNEKIKSKSNCLACHINIDKGVVAKALIDYKMVRGF